MNTSHEKLLRVCRTCLQEIEDDATFYPLDPQPYMDPTTLTYKLNTCIPELDLNLVPNSIVCCRCYYEINSTFEFKNRCLQAETKIHQFLQEVNASSVAEQSECVYESEMSDYKGEEFQNEEEASPDVKQMNVEPDVEECLPTFQVESESVEMNTDDGNNRPKNDLRNSVVQQADGERTILCCMYCNYKSRNHNYFKVHIENLHPKQYKCVFCDYLTNYELLLRKS